jgi:hypothetical protein
MILKELSSIGTSSLIRFSGNQQKITGPGPPDRFRITNGTGSWKEELHQTIP